MRWHSFFCINLQHRDELGGIYLTRLILLPIVLEEAPVKTGTEVQRESLRASTQPGPRCRWVLKVIVGQSLIRAMQCGLLIGIENLVVVCLSAEFEKTSRENVRPAQDECVEIVAHWAGLWQGFEAGPVRQELIRNTAEGRIGYSDLDLLGARPLCRWEVKLAGESIFHCEYPSKNNVVSSTVSIMLEESGIEGVLCRSVRVLLQDWGTGS